MMDAGDIRQRLERAVERFQVRYRKTGGWRDRYGGYLDEDDAAFPGYVGPFVWSEADLQHRFANELRNEFPDQFDVPAVHIGLPIRVGTRADLEKTADGKWPKQQHIDIVVTDPVAIPDHDGVAPQELGRSFREQTHLAFIEVKWFHKGSVGWLNHNWKAKVVDGVQPDLDRLAVHVAIGRCLVAGMLLLDDTETYVDRYDELHWPDTVMRLVVDRRNVNDDFLLLEE